MPDIEQKLPESGSAPSDDSPPQSEIGKSDFQKVYEWAGRAKDYVSVIAVGFGLVFGVGWLIEAIAFSNLGLGALDISKERAVCAGFFFWLGPGLIPLIGLLGWQKEKGCLYTFVAYIAAMACSSFFLFVFAGMKFDGPESAGVHGGYLSALATVFVWGFIVTRWTTPKSAMEKVVGVGLASVTLVMLISAHAVSSVPYFPDWMGGFSVRPVYLNLKEPSVARRALLVASDEHALIVAPYAAGDNGARRSSVASLIDRRYERIPWDRLVRMKRIDFGTSENNPGDPATMPTATGVEADYEKNTLKDLELEIDYRIESLRTLAIVHRLGRNRVRAWGAALLASLTGKLQTGKLAIYGSALASGSEDPFELTYRDRVHPLLVLWGMMKPDARFAEPTAKGVLLIGKLKNLSAKDLGSGVYEGPSGRFFRAIRTLPSTRRSAP